MPGSASDEYLRSSQLAMVSALAAGIVLGRSTGSARGALSIDELVGFGHVLAQRRERLLSVTLELQLRAFGCLTLEKGDGFLVCVHTEAREKRLIAIRTGDA